MSTWIGIFGMDLQKWNLGAGSKPSGDKQTIKGPGRLGPGSIITLHRMRTQTYSQHHIVCAAVRFKCPIRSNLRLSLRKLV
jgi:hypothetical protein